MPLGGLDPRQVTLATAFLTPVPRPAGFEQSRPAPSSCEGDGAGPHQPVRRREQHVEVLLDPAVAGLGKPEVTFDDGGVNR